MQGPRVELRTPQKNKGRIDKQWLISIQFQYMAWTGQLSHSRFYQTDYLCIIIYLKQLF